jgi:hypothetical protein
MIYVSRNRDDYHFVSQTVKRYRLCPVPTQRYYHELDYAWSEEGYSRTIERYPWGMVVFASHQTKSFTVVLVGEKVDVERLMVIGADEDWVLDIPWYQGLVECFRRSVMSGVTLPNCIGFWVACPTCDGGYNPETNEKEKPCKWVKRCIFFQDHLVEHNRQPTEFIDTEGVRKVMEVIIEKEKEKEEKRKEGLKKPEKRKYKRSRIPPAVRAKKRFAPLLEEYWVKYLAQLEKHVEECEELIWCLKRTQAVLPGSIFFILKTKRAIIYMRPPKGRDIHLMTVRFAPINKGLDIQIPQKKQPRDLPRGLRWTGYIDKPMYSIIRTVRTPKGYQWTAQLTVQIALAALKEFEK